jgi:competence protein ComEC
MSPVVFYIALLSFVGGVGIATFWSLSWPTLVWLSVVALGLGLIARRAPTSGRAAMVIGYLSIALVAIALGAARLEYATHTDGTSQLVSSIGQSVTLTGVVSQEPDVRERTQQLYVATETDTVLVFADRLDAIAYGDRVMVTGDLRLPEPFATDLGRTFNYPGYLRARGVEYVVYRPTVTVLESGLGNWFLQQLYTSKQRFITALEATLPEPHGGLAQGLLLGVKQALGDELELAFRQTGLVHIVVLSGYNVMLVVAFIMFVLSWLLPLRPRALFGIVAIICFALLVGLSATVVRASIMASIFLLAHAFGRTYAITRALVFAGAVMVALNPHILVYDVGFQLSFLATLGLVLIASQFETLLMTMPNRFSLRDFFIATVATQIAVLPLLLYQIGELSLVSVVVNMLVLPMVPVAMLLTCVTGVVGLISTSLAVVPAVFAYWSLAYMLSVVQFFAALPFAAVTVPAFPFVFVIGAYALYGWWLWRSHVVQAMSAPRVASPAVVDTSAIADWEIVTESDTALATAHRGPQTAGADHRSAPRTTQAASATSATDEPPIFFR